MDGALGSSLGSSFVGQLIQREKVHTNHGVFGSPDLDQSGKISAWLQSESVGIGIMVQKTMILRALPACFRSCEGDSETMTMSFGIGNNGKEA